MSATAGGEGVAATAGETSLISFQPVSAPLVSVVIPVHNHLDVTLECLKALAANTSGASYEVIVTDDASTDGTSAALAEIDGLRVVTLANNVGFLRATTAAVDESAGKYVFMLNNDAEVQRGWLQPLLDVAEADDRVAAVASKLVFPDGRLQEAGGIVWDDGSAWNFGYGADPDEPTFNYRRQIDYASAAALLVRRDAFHEVGGFDIRFDPAYYEDADLCFKLQDHGYSVVYQPQSVVTHIGSHSHEGRGAESSPHTKLSIKYNQEIFSAKWATVLDKHWPNGTAQGHRGGKIRRNPYVLICTATVPAGDANPAGSRMSGMVEIFHELGCNVTVLPMDGVRREPYTDRFQQMGIEVMYSPWGIEHLAQTRPDLYDIAMLSGSDVGEALLKPVRRAFPGARLIYDAGDLRHLLGSWRLELALGDLSDARRLELRLMRNADHIGVVTTEDAELVERLVPRAQIALLPNASARETLCDQLGELLSEIGRFELPQELS